MHSRLVSLAMITLAAGVLTAGCADDAEPSGPTVVAVTGVSLDHAALGLVVGAPGTSAVLTATVAPSNATNRALTWTTSDADVASLSAVTGEAVTVTGHAEGTATITVTSADGGRSAQCLVTVSPVPVESVVLDHTTLRLVRGAPGTSRALIAAIAPLDATHPDLTWTTSDPDVVSLSATTGGTVTVTAHAAGTATITVAAADGPSATCDVSVALLDVAIPADTASTQLVETTPGSGQYDTKIAGAYAEIAVDDLLFYSSANGFKDGDAGGGIFFNWYASGAGAEVGATQGMSSYLAVVPAAIATTAESVRFIVTAKAAAGSGEARLALLEHGALASGRVIAVGEPLGEEAAEYVFDGVPPNAQIDLCDGGPNGQSMYVEAIRVEPSATAVPDTTPPANVTGLSAATDVVNDTQVVLSWTLPADADLDGVEITYPGLATPIAVAATEAGATLTGLTAGQTYTFTVRTVDTTGNRSGGATVNATPGVVPALLDEAIPASLAATVSAATTATPAVEVTVPGSSFAYYARLGGEYFKANDGKFMFNTAGITATAVGATPSTVTSYVGVPAAYTTTAATSVKITVMATQYSASAGLNLALMDASNKVIASTTIAAGQSSGATPAAYVFDGVVPNGALRITCDASYMYVTNVKVEASATAVQYQ